MRRFSLRLAAASALTVAGLIPQALRAQDSNDWNDPPSRAARLSWVEGNVSFQPGGVEDWVPAALNRPLTTGDRLWTEAGARAELNLGSAAFRLTGGADFTFLNLSDIGAQVQLSSGILSVRVRNLAQQESFEIDTPQAAFSLQRPGDYRIEVNEQGDATIATVRDGQAEVNADGQVFPIRAGDQVRVTEENGRVAFNRRAAPAFDAFDNWRDERDRREDRSESARYMSRDIPGYADLDGNGVWRDDPQYASVWMPRVSSGWAPYGYGHWAWIEPWGWTWVDDAPWGYAPFHYGRWVSIRGAWGWVPGPMVVRPVYSPAMVAWVGGPNFSIGVSAGGPPVGWFPLGPREVWVPPYRYSPRYIERVNVTNTVIVNRTTINNINVSNVNYVNRRVPGAMTAAPRDVMMAGRPIGGAAMRVSPEAAARGQVSAYAAVAPQRSAVLDGRAPGRAAPPAAVMSRRIVARETPPPPPVPFAQRQTALQANPGRPLDRATVSQIERTQTPRPGFRQANIQSSPQAGPRPDAGLPRPQGRGQSEAGPPQRGRPQPQAQQPSPPQPQVQPPLQPEVNRQRPVERPRGEQQDGQQRGRPQPQTQQPAQQPQVQRQSQPEAGAPKPVERPEGQPRGGPPARGQQKKQQREEKREERRPDQQN